MKRRHFLGTVAATAGGLAGARVMAERFDLLPPDAAGVWGPGHALNYAAHRLLGRDARAREFSREQISAQPFSNDKPPDKKEYQSHLAEDFRNWGLEVTGLVSQPRRYTLSELRGQPAASQITQLQCEEGWSYIAEWTGVPLERILQQVGAAAKAKYVVYYAMDGWWDSVDIDEARHPQTQITHTMNGRALPPGHGGPLRMRVPRQLGYKSVKYITRLVVTDDIRAFGRGRGSASAEAGYAWYNGI